MRTLIRSAVAVLTMSATLVFSTQALADKASLKSNLGAARERVVAIVSGKGEASALKPEISELSAKIDAEADSVPGFKAVWEQFKQNRDGKIIPAFDGSHPEEKDAAKVLAMGEQKQLYQKMIALLD